MEVQNRAVVPNLGSPELFQGFRESPLSLGQAEKGEPESSSESHGGPSWLSVLHITALLSWMAVRVSLARVRELLGIWVKMCQSQQFLPPVAPSPKHPYDVVSLDSLEPVLRGQDCCRGRKISSPSPLCSHKPSSVAKRSAECHPIFPIQRPRF